MPWEQDRNQIEVYSEGRKRRQFVGVLRHDSATSRFRFEYDGDYLRSDRAIPLGPELSLARPSYESEPGALFPSFSDRIPSRNNPAYAEYCQAAGISPEETDPMMILPAIARRGPSTFIFEAIWKDNQTIGERVKQFRKDTNLSFFDLAQLLDIPVLSIKRLEAGQTRRDSGLIGMVRIVLDHPDVFLELLHIRGARIHDDTRHSLEMMLQK